MRETLPNNTRIDVLVFMEYAHDNGESDFLVNWKKKVVNSVKSVNPEKSKERDKNIYELE